MTKKTDKAKQSAWTFLMVAALTALIWIYADQATTKSIIENLSVQVTAPSGSDLILTPNKVQFAVTLKGPRARLEDIKNNLRAGRVDLRYYVDPSEAQGPQLTKSAREVLNQLIRQRDPSISVTGVEPETLRIAVDRYVTVAVPIKVITGSIKTTEPEPALREIEVKLTESALDTLSSEQLYASVDIEAQLKDRLENQIVDIDEEFPIEQTIAGHSVKTDPPRVKVHLTIEELYDNITLELRIEVMCLPELLKKYRPIYGGSIPTDRPVVLANFRGPKELIDVLKSADIKAFTRIEAEDIGRLMYPKDVEFHGLPQGITVDMSEPPKVDFKLEPITGQTLGSTP